MEVTTDKLNKGELDKDEVIITPLGAGQETGRSCIIVKYKDKTVMLDCGLHIGKKGFSSLPFFDNIQPSELDLVLITHFHLDHSAALPYFLEKTDFKGKCYMTYPTKAIYQLIIYDQTKMWGTGNQLYDEKDINNAVRKIKCLDYHQQIVDQKSGIKFTFYNAGHVIGAAMILLEIGGVKILYSGDYSTEKDYHLSPAQVPNEKIDVFIVESTHGVSIHEKREKKEKRFTEKIHSIIGDGGKCLLPVFSFGRVQELLLILEKYWQNNKDLHDVPIYYIFPLASKCTEIFQSYVYMLGTYMKQQYHKGINPFHFKYIQTVKNLDNLDFNGKDPCVVISSHGMIQTGVSREVFDAWCSNEQNGVILTHYTVEGTIAHELKNNPKTIVKQDKTRVDCLIQVDEISFSAHADGAQTIEFIQKLQPKNVILIHGEKRQGEQLLTKLKEEYKQQVVQPENCQSVHFSHLNYIKNCKILGQIEEQISSQSTEDCKIDIEGVLVKENNDFYFMSYQDYENNKYEQKSILEKIYINCLLSFNNLKIILSQLFEQVEVVTIDSKIFIKVNNEFLISKHNQHPKQVTIQ